MSNIELPAFHKTSNYTLDLPGSKSIANRVLLLAAVANGVSYIHNVPNVAEDVMLMLNALIKLGVEIQKINTVNGCSSYKIIGVSGDFPVGAADIFCGNSGTTIRFLCAMLSVIGNDVTLSGIPRMHERPIADLVEALKQIGCQIDYILNDGYPPINIKKLQFNNNDIVRISGKTSSQYLTALLMALPLLKQTITIIIMDEIISKPYVDITLSLLKMFGCEITCKDNSYNIKNNMVLNTVNYTIEPDASSASYFLAIGALNGSMMVNNLNASSLQGDKNFAKALSLMGAKVGYGDVSITVSYAPLTGININMEDMPDVAMTLAVVALFATGITHITGVQSWKVKETDRLQAMHNELTKLGAKVDITDNSIKITPPHKINQNIAIDTYNDHRMAMCFSILPFAGVPVTINDYECVGKTFANFFDIINNMLA
ncbi:MAG: 3-phosphoshikimate 1-carboxyvinyltransferase [Proteobacteria bacterium]|nr:3-phosphoshikimate 1-carboxyvinyltransferase [Pseudomonadota bacterium]